MAAGMVPPFCGDGGRKLQVWSERHQMWLMTVVPPLWWIFGLSMTPHKDTLLFMFPPSIYRMAWLQSLGIFSSCVEIFALQNRQLLKACHSCAQLHITAFWSVYIIMFYFHLILLQHSFACISTLFLHTERLVYAYYLFKHIKLISN